MRVLRPAVALAALSLCSAAAEAKVFWSVPASTCVLASTASSTGQTKTNTASVEFASGKIGSFVLNCPISRMDVAGFAWRVNLTYRDSTGTATAGSVAAQIFKMPVGAITPAAVGGISSNSSAITTDNNLSTAFINHVFDFDANTYWARITVRRATSAQSVVFHALIIEGLPF
jgi:hypothetical protein